MVLVRVVGDALRPGDGEEVDEGLVGREGGEEVTHVVRCWEPGREDVTYEYRSGQTERDDEGEDV